VRANYTLVAWQFLLLMADKLIGHVVPVRFAIFALIGGLGVVAHLAEFRLRADRGHDLCDDVDFLPEQPVYLSRPPHSGLAYIAWLGVLLLYLRSRRDRQHRNWLVRLRYDQTWWLAGLAGVAIGAVWNYAVSSVFVWKR
jgi:dolichol-phosphate mannosyltransferase